VTKTRVCKSAGQEGSLGCSQNVGECEGMNPHTLKGVSTLGVEVPMDSQIFKK